MDFSSTTTSTSTIISSAKLGGSTATLPLTRSDFYDDCQCRARGLDNNAAPDSPQHLRRFPMSSSGARQRRCPFVAAAPTTISSVKLWDSTTTLSLACRDLSPRKKNSSAKPGGSTTTMPLACRGMNPAPTAASCSFQPSTKTVLACMDFAASMSTHACILQLATYVKLPLIHRFKKKER